MIARFDLDVRAGALVAVGAEHEEITLALEAPDTLPRREVLRAIIRMDRKVAERLSRELAGALSRKR